MNNKKLKFNIEGFKFICSIFNFIKQVGFWPQARQAGKLMSWGSP